MHDRIEEANSRASVEGLSEPMMDERAWEILKAGVDDMVAKGDLRLSDYFYVRDQLFPEPQLPSFRTLLRRVFGRDERPEVV